MKKRSYHVFSYTDGVYLTPEPMGLYEVQRYLQSYIRGIMDMQGYFFTSGQKRSQPHEVNFVVINAEDDPFNLPTE